MIQPGLLQAARRELAILANTDSPITGLTNLLVREGLRDESALIKAVAEECGLPLIVLSAISIAPEALQAKVTMRGSTPKIGMEVGAGEV